jgi:hypothetical protein
MSARDQRSELRDCVTFGASFPDDAQWNENGDLILPGGKAVLDAFRKGMQGKGLVCSESEQYEFYGWAFHVRKDAWFVMFLLAEVPEGWLLQIVPHRSFINRLFRRPNLAQLRIWTQAVHEVLSEDDRFSIQKWWTRREYYN